MNRKLVLALTLTLLVGMLNVANNVQNAKASGTIYIRADGSIDPPDAPISTVDNVTYTFTYDIHDEIVVQRSNMTIDGNGLALEGTGTVDSKGIYISDVSSITVKNTYIKDYYFGIYLNNTSNDFISQNTMTGNAYGVQLCNLTQSGYELQFNYGSSNNTISGNSITNSSGHGIVLLYSSNNSIYGNDITNSSGNGIELDGSSYNSIHGNIVTGNGIHSIWFVFSYNNTVSRNIVAANQEGVRLYGSSNNTVSGNNIENNANGIGIERYSGFYGDDIPAENNTICHNNFIGNTHQVAFAYGFANVWDDVYPSGGNYWSDYNGTDVNGDGIGDTPYVIDANNRDRYPLMSPWSPLSVHNINTGLGYAKIQEAVDANETINGHVIFVDEGIYYENVVVNKTLTLIGENRETTIIDGNRTGNVIKITANDVNVVGFTVQNSGMSFSNSGVWLDHSNESSVSGNVIRNNGYFGVNIESSLCNVTENIVESNKNIGIWLFNSPYGMSRIYSNLVTNNGYEGISLSYSMAIVAQNVVTNNTSHGVYLENSANSFVTENTIANNEGIGVYLRDSGFTPNNYFVAGNTISKNAAGIGSELSINVSITENKIMNNSDCGVWFYEGRVSVNNNIIANNGRGIYISGADGSTLKENLIVSSDSYGIILHSDFSNVISNNLLDNSIGMSLEGLGNNIYQNNFIRNTKQTESFNLTNILDSSYPSGGNYWSDCNGTDLYGGSYQNLTGCDGIDDTPYFIDANSIDNYPLMGMFSDSNATSKYHVQTICNSSISDFLFDGTAIRFNVTGDNDTTGFCRICIPTALMNAIYKVFVNGTEASYNQLPCSNETYSYLYFNYTHSTQAVIIIPEFPSFLIPMLSMIAALLAVTVYRRRMDGADG